MSLLKNEWDEIFLCPACAEALRVIEDGRAEPIATGGMVLPEARLAYFIAGEVGPVKIGVARMPEARLRELQTGYPYRLSILATCEGGQEREAEYHRRFAAHRLHGEWFEPHPEILAEITRLNASSQVTM